MTSNPTRQKLRPMHPQQRPRTPEPNPAARNSNSGSRSPSEYHRFWLKNGRAQPEIYYGIFCRLRKSACGAIINKSMVLYCFVCFYCLLGYLYRRRRKIFALLTIFLQFLLLKQCISKGFGDPKPPKMFATCGRLSDKKARAFLTLIPLISGIPSRSTPPIFALSPLSGRGTS